MSDYPALRVANLAQNSATSFDIRPDSKALVALRDQLGLSGLRKLRFHGTVKSRGKRDWQLAAHLGASVTQACVITLEPVTTRIDVDVRRTYLANWTAPTEDEVEIADDDSIEPLGSHIDPYAVLSEALALALPLYPRKPQADPGETVFTAPGKTPMKDEDARPFAGLAGLRDSLKGDT